MYVVMNARMRKGNEDGGEMGERLVLAARSRYRYLLGVISRWALLTVMDCSFLYVYGYLCRRRWCKDSRGTVSVVLDLHGCFT